MKPLVWKESKATVPLREVGTISCGHCEAQYATVGGVPYLGTLSTEYFESLLELSAIGANVFQNKFDL
ncbi:MAG: hypothetical protein K2X47_10565, partial [Bdellovibrionales bacterium]|nr:hypothetical protein [Bdellovibrionales bacterium]